MRKTSTAMGLVLAVTALPVIAQTTYTYTDLDLDGNLELSQVEFDTFGREIFMTWDADADGNLAEDEFYQGIYDIWDVDRDGIVTEVEYEDGWSNWFDEDEYVAYADLDLNADGMLTVEEFHTGLTVTGLYDTSEGMLGEEEFTTAVYGIYDTDDDELLSEDEFGEISYVVSADYTSANEVISLSDWRFDDLYAGGVSAEVIIDGMDVYDVSGENIGEVEDIIVGSTGEVLSVIAEVGGLWDIGDTHVSIPWSDIEIAVGGDGVIVPVTEDNVDEYGYFGEYGTEVITAAEAGTSIISEVDDAYTGDRAWRASEVIGDYARLGDNSAYRNYGYVNDLILRNGEVAAVVVEPDSSYGYDGYQAYPYYGYDADYGWNPGNNYYDLPYDETEVGAMEPFDYNRLEN